MKKIVLMGLMGLMSLLSADMVIKDVLKSNGSALVLIEEDNKEYVEEMTLFQYEVLKIQIDYTPKLICVIKNKEEVFIIYTINNKPSVVQVSNEDFKRIIKGDYK
ncbi:MAG: hypothetical protein Q8J85_07280 [Sulfuricurvum sp.]|nr:hypothetical protein [Sulfuricurvum sp.]MDP3022971.1 hypothetical protein [Sulfuricurvum sp.]